VGLLQRVLRQRVLLAGQWNLLRMEENALLPGLLGHRLHHNHHHHRLRRLLQWVPGQCILLASQWDLLRMEEQALLPGMLVPVAQLLQWVPRQCVLLASQWDLLRVEEQGLLRDVRQAFHCRFGCPRRGPGASEDCQRHRFARNQPVHFRGGGLASGYSGRKGLLQWVPGQRILLTSQWEVLRVDEQALLREVLVGAIGQLLQWLPRQRILLASQWDLLRMEKQGLLRDVPALRAAK